MTPLFYELSGCLLSGETQLTFLQQVRYNRVDLLLAIDAGDGNCLHQIASTHDLGRVLLHLHLHETLDSLRDRSIFELMVMRGQLYGTVLLSLTEVVSLVVLSLCVLDRDWLGFHLHACALVSIYASTDVDVVAYLAGVKSGHDFKLFFCDLS